MPLRGGAADKAGNRYEARWVVRNLIDVMRGEAKSLRYEVPGEAGKGTEFVLVRDPGVEHHQVKRQHGSAGKWTTQSLASAGVLECAWSKLMDPNASYHFVSADGVAHLRELSERARDSSSIGEFKREFLAGGLRGAFDALCRRWHGCTETVAYGRLQRLYLQTIDERTLTAQNSALLELLAQGAGDPVASLFGYVFDSIHQERNAHDLWHHLAQKGFSRRSLAGDVDVSTRILEQTERYLRPVRALAIRGKELTRGEASLVLEKLVSPEGPRACLVEGVAGVGKTGVLAQVVRAVKEQGWPVLAFRVDRLEPTQDPREVGRQLNDLPGSPAAVLAGAAEGKDSLLVVDQLDTVSRASGRHPAFFDCVNEIVEAALAYDGVRVVLACRTYDLDNDSRFRALVEQGGVAERVPVRPLPEDTVRAVVSQLGFDAAALNDRQLALLALPQNLWLLNESASSMEGRPLRFTSSKELFDEYWEHKQRLLRERYRRSIGFATVIEAVCGEMSSRQSLSVPSAFLDGTPEEKGALVSENVLVEEAGRVSFFHQSFFDYAFARGFLGRNEDFAVFLLADEQDLFRRAQVRQVLAHLRDSDRPAYLRALGELLANPGIRFHLKQMVSAHVGALPDPSPEEWVVLEPFYEQHAADEPLARRLFQDTSGRQPWFDLLDRLGKLGQWLDGTDDRLRDRAWWYLRLGHKGAADRVAELVEKYVGVSDECNTNLVRLYRHAELAAGRRFFDLFLRMIREGLLDQYYGSDAPPDSFWMWLHTLARKEPLWAAEASKLLLQRGFKLAQRSGKTNPFDMDDWIVAIGRGGKRVLDTVRRAVPGSLVEALLPFVLAVLEANTDTSKDSPLKDDLVWLRRYPFGSGARNVVATALESALCDVARTDPEAFAAFATQLRDAGFKVTALLLLKAYAANPERFADEAALTLIDMAPALAFPYGPALLWAGRELIGAIAHHCGPDRWAALQEALLAAGDVVDASDERAQYQKGLSVTLLKGVPEHLRSAGLSARIASFQELPEVGKPEPFESYTVGSPIPLEQARGMTIDEWLAAVERYDKERSGRDPKTGRHVGGARELSRAMSECVKADTSRFAELADRMPENINPLYFGAIASGMHDAGIDADVAERVCRRLHSLPGKPCGTELCELVRKKANLPLAGDVLDAVAWYATDDPDPEEELWRTVASGGMSYYSGDAFTAGINSTRGVAAQAVGALIYEDEARFERLGPTIERMVCDQSIAVRSCVAQALCLMLRHDGLRDVAVRAFLRLCETEDVLLGTPHVEEFLFHSRNTHFGETWPIVERMAASADVDVAQAGARRVCLAALTREEDLAQPTENCLSGGEAQGLGAAEVFKANIADMGPNSFCQEALVRLFSHKEAKVRTEAAECFRNLAGEDFGQYGTLVRSFLVSPAFEAGRADLVEALAETAHRLPEVVQEVCDRALALSAASAQDPSSVQYWTQEELCALVFRLHEQSLSSGSRGTALDLIDRACKQDAPGFGTLLSRFDER